VPCNVFFFSARALHDISSPSDFFVPFESVLAIEVVLEDPGSCFPSAAEVPHCCASEGCSFFPNIYSLLLFDSCVLCTAGRSFFSTFHAQRDFFPLSSRSITFSSAPPLFSSFARRFRKSAFLSGRLFHFHNKTSIALSLSSRERRPLRSSLLLFSFSFALPIRLAPHLPPCRRGLVVPFGSWQSLLWDTRFPASLPLPLSPFPSTIRENFLFLQIRRRLMKPNSSPPFLLPSLSLSEFLFFFPPPDLVPCPLSRGSPLVTVRIPRY